MTLQLEISEQLRRRLEEEARKRGSSVTECAMEVLEQSLPEMEGKTPGARILLRWAKESENVSDEESARNVAALHAIDENRDRKLFEELSEKPL